MSPAQRSIHASLETRDSHNQAALEGAALRGELGIDAQLIALSAKYMELKAAGDIKAARAVRAQAAKLYEGAK